ncbi:hypothetical protein BGZ83_004497 [Gryganskiella cystojenkinii]|nr:hypothetical protein BGZ83_004497 [Gryganskiella cystojenkinii]
MPGELKSWIRALEIPELVQTILPYLDIKSLHTVRLLNKTFHDHCSAFFSITLDIGNDNQYLDLGEKLSSAAALHDDDDDVQDHPSPFNNKPLDHIQGLNLAYEHDMYKRLPFFIPNEKIDKVLNRCRNLRRIKVEDIPGGVLKPITRALIPSLESNSDHLQSAACYFSSGWPALTDHQFYLGGRWSLWDMLPLEDSSLLSRMESLSLSTKVKRSLNLNGFLQRLSHDYCSAVKTLKTLEIVAVSEEKSVSWEVFRACVCSLRSLQNLKIEGLTILPEDENEGHARGANELAHRQHRQ